MTNQAKAMASNSASSVAQMKSQMKSYGKSVIDTSKQQEHLKAQIEELEYKLHQADLGFEVGDTLKIEADIEKLNNRLIKLQGQSNNTGKEMNGAFGKIKASVKNAISNMSGFGKKFKEIISSSKNMGKSLTGAFNNGIKSIKKFALSLLSVRTAFSMISRAMQSYLSFDTQLSNSIQNCWNVLGSLLAPILEYLVSLFTKLVSYVNAFVKALTGVDLVARANAKAIDKQTKSTKKMSEAQSSLDEFHTINKDSSGDENNSISVGEVDTSKLDVLFGWIDKAKQLLSTLFDPIKQAWDSKGLAFIDGFKNAITGLGTLGMSVFGSIMSVWTNGTGQTIVENLLVLWTNLFNIVGYLSQALSTAWTTAGNGTAIIQSLANIFISIQDLCNSILNSLMSWFISDGFQQALNVVMTIITNLFGYVQQIRAWVVTMYETYLAPVVDKILNCISNIIIAIGSIWNFLSPMIESILNVIMNILEPAIAGLCGFIGGIVDALSGIMTFITGVFTGDWKKAWNGIKDFIKGIINALGSLFSGLWNTLKNGGKKAWEGIKAIFSSVASFFKNVFSKAWNGVKNIFSAGGKVFSGIKDGIANAFKKVVNTLIAGINKVVAIPFNAINTALRTVRDISFLGIEPFKGLIKLISVPQIPSLATGGVLSQETLVRVAEYNNARTNPEIVSPKDMMKETFKEAIEESGMNNISSQKVEVEVTGETKIDGDDIVIVYDKAKNNKGYNGGKNPSFAY